MVYSVLADIVVILHLAYAGFVVFGFISIAMGRLFRWSWTRHKSFRIVHLSCIGFVALEALLGADCPLTVLENRLLVAAGQVSYQRSFIGHVANRLLFYDAPEWVFTGIYVVLFLLGFLAYFLFPSYRKVKQPKDA